VLAANAILINMLHLMSFALDGFAHAAEALVGKAVGAGDRKALRRAVTLALRWSLYVSVLFSLFFLAGGRPLVRLLTDLPEVIEVANEYLAWLVLLPMVAVWSYLYDGVFVGATRAREMRDIMLISSFLVFIPAWYAFRFLDNHGLWLALCLFLASRGIGMHYYYRKRVLTSV
jgi:MATE family multidrug resistance protein